MNSVLVGETIYLCTRSFVSGVGLAVWVNKVKIIIIISTEKIKLIFHKTLLG